MSHGVDGLREQIAKRRRKRLAEGGWFMRFMARHARRVLAKQRKRAKADALRARFTDADVEEICRVAVRNASLLAAGVGATAGAIITVAEIFAVMHLGHPLGFAIVVALIEFAMLERMQIRMVFTLSELRDIQMAHDHMHEVSALYGHVLKVKGATRVAAYGRQGALLLFRTVGLRFAQRAALKFAIPLIAIVMGGLLNYWLTTALGRHTNDRFRKKSKVDDRLDRLLHHNHDCQRLLISLMTLMASAEGPAHKNERDLIMRTLDSMGVFGDDRVALLSELELDEDRLIESLEAIDDEDFLGLMLEMMTLAAVADGAVSANEHRVLGRVAVACGHELDHDHLIDEHDDFLTRRARKARRQTRA